MIDLKKQATTGALLLSSALAGAGVHATVSSSLNSEAHPVVMRWLDEGVGKPSRFALTIATQIGANPGAREIVCEADGTQPKLNGVAFDDNDAAALCKAMASFGDVAAASATKLTNKLVK